MVKTLVFTHSLDLALRLVDTTNGRNVSGRGVMIDIDGAPVPYGEKADGLLVFRNLDRRSFRLEVTSGAYEKAELTVDLGTLDKTLPLLEIHLLPGANYPAGTALLTVEGTMPGIEEISAVRLEENDACLIREFDPRRRVIKLFNPHHLSLDRVQYALVDPDGNRFEPFRILRMPDDTTVKIDRVLEMPFKNYFSVNPVVFGKTEPDGRYCLRVRDDAEGARWLIRWVRNGEVGFRMVDFRSDETWDLKEVK